jgi:hypothetical protein
MIQPTAKRIRSLAAALLTFVIASPAAADDAVPKVTNFKFGLVCGEPSNRRVCLETNILQVTNESRCVFNGKIIACTWYGYSFDYDTATDVTLDCVDSADTPMANGNPKELLSSSTSRIEFKMKLKQGSHHFFIGQYIGGEKDGKSPAHGVEACSLNGTQLFLVDFQYQFPEPHQPVVSVPDLQKAPPEQ